MAATKKYLVMVWWTGKHPRYPIVDLSFSVQASSDLGAIRSAHSTFKKIVNLDSIKTTDSVQFRVLNPDGKVIKDFSVFL